MKVWTVYEMANRRGPGAVYKYWARCRGSGLGWPPRRTGGERVAGSLLAPGLPQAVRVLLRLWLCEWVLLRLWCCAGVPLRRWHCAWVLLRLWPFAWVLLRWWLCARVLLRWWLCARVLFRWWLCARVQPRLRACAWVLVWAVAQLPRAPWLLRVVGRCVPGRVLLRSVRVSFSVSRHSLVSLCSLKRIFRYPLFTADRVRVFSRFVGPWSL